MRIGRTGVDHHGLIRLAKPQHGMKCVVFNLCNNNPFQPSIQVTDEVSGQVVGHGTRRGDLLDLDSDGVGLKDPHPDRASRYLRPHP